MGPHENARNSNSSRSRTFISDWELHDTSCMGDETSTEGDNSQGDLGVEVHIGGDLMARSLGGIWDTLGGKSGGGGGASRIGNPSVSSVLFHGFVFTYRGVSIDEKLSPFELSRSKVFFFAINDGKSFQKW